MRKCALAVMVMLAGAAAATPGAGADAVKVEGAWARPAASGNGAAYMRLDNGGSEADRLVSATSPVAGAVELHTHEIDANGVARMRPVPAIEVPAGASASLAPGGMHVMLIGLKAPLREGQAFPLTLAFERAGTLTVQVAVGSGPGHAGH